MVSVRWYLGYLEGQLGGAGMGWDSIPCKALALRTSTGHGPAGQRLCGGLRLQQTPKSWNMDLCWFSFFPLLWDQRTVIFRLCGFYCRLPRIRRALVYRCRLLPWVSLRTPKTSPVAGGGPEPLRAEVIFKAPHVTQQHTRHHTDRSLGPTGVQ